METIGRYVMIGGIVLFLVGGGIYLSAKLGLPLMSSILASAVVTVVVNVIAKLLKK